MSATGTVIAKVCDLLSGARLSAGFYLSSVAGTDERELVGEVVADGRHQGAIRVNLSAALVSTAADDDSWLSHPELVVAPEIDFFGFVCLHLWPWVSNSAIRGEILTSNLPAEYSHAAWDAGIRDGEKLLAMWHDGIPAEYLSAF